MVIESFGAKKHHQGESKLMKIGIPRSLLYYYYVPFLKPFFEELGMEVVISEETNKHMMNQGVKESVAELCVPIKVFVGHSYDLLEKDVDYIFVPRFESIKEGEYFCPKFMGLPDMMEHGVKGMEEKVLTCEIISENDNISDYRLYLSLKEKLGVTEEQIKNAANKANDEWLAFRMYCKMGHTITESIELLENKNITKRIRTKNAIKIGLVGYVYNVYDPFISMDITKKLDELGVEFVTFEMEDENEIMDYIKDMEKNLFWTFSNKLLGFGYKLFRNREVDGVIHLTAFGCGPDSFLSKLLEYESEDTGIPFMMIRVDEHTGENHLQTRIEAFIDMLRRKKRIVG